MHHQSMPKLSSVRRYIYAFRETFFWEVLYTFLVDRRGGCLCCIVASHSVLFFCRFPVANPNLCRDTLHTTRILSSIAAAINIKTLYIHYRAPQE
jgi:hypothetical protein